MQDATDGVSRSFYRNVLVERILTYAATLPELTPVLFTPGGDHMDRITKSLLDEFAKDNDLTRLSEDKQFEHFATFLTAGRFLTEALDTSDAVIGSGGDTGIDAVAIIINGALVTDPDLVAEFAARNGYLDVAFIFVQAETSSHFDSAKIGQFAFGVQDFFKTKPTLPRSKAVNDVAKVMSAVFDRSSSFKRGNPVCRLYYVTTGTWAGDANLEARRKAAMDDLTNLRLFREVEVTPIDANTVQRFYRDSRNSVSHNFEFTQRTIIPAVPGVTEAYLGLLPAKEFIGLVQDAETGDILKGIFYDNVRDWQDYNIVNSEMKETIASTEQRARFALMNNGVTVIAKTLRTTGNRFFIEDYQVVNGCQTSHVLFDQRAFLDDSVMVPLRLIATQDEDVIASIIKATNRQTEVKEEQLLALSDFQKKLESFFAAFDLRKRLYYERRSRQYHSTVGIEKTRVVTPSNLIRSFASMFLEDPHRTTRSYKEMLERVGTTIFAASDRLEPYYVAAFALYRLEYLFRSQALDAKFKPARFQILLAFRLLHAGPVRPRMNSRDMEKYCTPLMEILWDAERTEKAFLEAAGAVETVSGGKFDSDVLRTQPFTEKLRVYCDQKRPPSTPTTKSPTTGRQTTAVKSTTAPKSRTRK